MSAVPADADALPSLPFDHSLSHIIDHSGYFVARDTRVLQAGPMALFDEHVAVAETASLDFDADLVGTWVWNVPFDRLERGAWTCDLDGSHLWHRGASLLDQRLP